MEKTHIYFANVSELKLEKVLPFLPSFRIEKINNLKLEEDKKLSAGVWLLLSKALKKHHINLKKHEFKTTSSGKPYLNGSSMQISYSHSGDYCVVALSKEPIGIDIEKIRKIDEKISKLIFDESDIAKLKEKSFLDIWTLKEAFGKKDGKGLSKEIVVDYCNALNIDKIKGYMIGVTSNKKVRFKQLKI